MPFEDPWLRRGQGSLLEGVRRNYAKTNNPLYVWLALQICKGLMRNGTIDALPPWVHEYLFAGADKMEAIFDLDDIDDVPKLIAAALGFQQRGRGVRRQAFREFSRDLNDRLLAGRVWREIRRQPTQSIEAIVAALAEAEQASPERIWRVWAKWKASHDE